MTRFTTRRTVLAALLAAVAGVGNAHAQAYTLAGGARTFNGDEGESTTMAALRSEFPVGTTALVEFASSVAEVPRDGRGGVSSVFEAQLQLPVPLGGVVPYVGVGAGIGHVNAGSGGRDPGWQGVLSAGAGVRVALAGQLGVVFDARVRGLGTGFAGSHTDLSLGLRYSLARPDRPRFRGAP